MLHPGRVVRAMMARMGAGRYAPSPTGDLHLGNLRTALLAWLFARSRDEQFLLRFEDLETSVVKPDAYRSQREDLRALGLEPDGEEVRQSDRREFYRSVIVDLDDRGLTYPCWCSRREIREAGAAPNGPWAPGAYPGTCRELTSSQRAERDATGRPPALRLRTSSEEVEVVDDLHGRYRGLVDDVVLRRGDGTPAYNLCVVVDDDAQGVTHVVRADDLLSSTPRQVHVASVLEIKPPGYAHVPLVLGADGDRLAKRHGAVTMRDHPGSALQVRSELAASLGLCEPAEEPSLGDLLARFNPARLPRDPWIFGSVPLLDD